MSLITCELWKYLSIPTFDEQEKNISHEHTPVFEFSPKVEHPKDGETGEHTQKQNSYFISLAHIY